MKLMLTACHHGDQEFYELGLVEHEVPAEKLLAMLPADTVHDCGPNDVCFVVDAMDDQDDIVADRNVSADLARKLLDQNLDEALAESQQRLNDIYRSLGSAKRVPLKPLRGEGA